MKKVSLIIFTGLFVVVAATSCKKIVDAIFSGVEVTAPDITVGIPAVPFVLPVEMNLGTYNQTFNLDSAIRANTAGTFGAGVVSSIKVKTYTINVPDADDNNNLSNFQSARVVLTSNSKSEPVEIFNLTFPTTNTSTLTVTPTNSPELLPYLQGGQLSYQVFGRARKTTSKPLTMVVSVVMTGK